MRDPIIKRYKVPMIVIQEDDEAIRIIETSWKDIYSVIYEDAYQSGDCGHSFITSKEIEDKYKIDIKKMLRGIKYET